MHVHSFAGLLHANFQVPSVSYEDFMDVAGEGKAPTRAHVLAAAQKAGLAAAVARRVIDEVLERLTPPSCARTPRHCL